MADRYWIAPSSAFFNNIANWSTISGGSGGASVPGSSDYIFFDELGQGDCTADISIDVLNLCTNFDYTGTLDQNSNSFIVRQDATFSDGTFHGSGQDVIIYGSLNFWGGSIHTGDKKISVYGNLICDNGFVSVGTDATISMDSTNNQKIITSGGVLPTLCVDKTSSNQVKIYGDSTALYIKGDFIITNGILNTNGHDIFVGALHE